MFGVVWRFYSLEFKIKCSIFEKIGLGTKNVCNGDPNNGSVKLNT